MNAIIHKHNSDEIKYFVKDCVRRGASYFGSNAKIGIGVLSGLKMKLLEGKMAGTKQFQRLHHRQIRQLKRHL
jgi:hypothetical protein